MLALRTLRAPLGQVVSRKVTDHTYKPNGIPGLDSPCVVITYDTAFAKADADVETVILKWENGKWLGLSYTLGPKPSETSDSDSIPQSTTTTTTSHIKPEVPKTSPSRSSETPQASPAQSPEAPLPQ